MRTLLMALALVALTSCSNGVPPVSQSAESQVPPTASPAPTSSPSPVSVAAALAPPADIAVAFSGLRAGTFPVHVHSRCSGNQAFHIVTVESLRVMSTGTGSIAVPRGYFGRGLCLIVYANQSLSTVLTTRPI
jgi:hypothetical protein